MRIQDVTESAIDEGPVWNKVKAGVKKILAPREKKHPLIEFQGRIKQIFKKIINGEKLDNTDIQFISDLYRKI